MLAAIARWADESPDAMRRLLTDAELRAALGAALADLVPADSSAPGETVATAS